MIVRDLGQMDDDLLLFGGVYSNLQALEAVLAWAKGAGLGPDQMICSGDIAAYCADAYETVQQIMDLGLPVVAGNCERQLAENAPDCGCGYDADSTCSILSGAWYAHASARVTDAQRAWMGDLPDRAVFDHHGRRFAVIHGGASDISAFLWPTDDDAVFAREISLLRDQVGDFHGVIAGHCGIPFERTVGGVQWFNTGAIGMPPHDGDPRGSFAVMRGGQVAFHRFEYDRNTAHQAMVKVGLVQGYHQSLLSGYLPSEDTLPAALHRAASG